MLMDALFQEGQSAPQTPQTLFDADFEGLASNAEVYILIRIIVRIGFGFLCILLS